MLLTLDIEYPLRPIYSLEDGPRMFAGRTVWHHSLVLATPRRKRTAGRNQPIPDSVKRRRPRCALRQQAEKTLIGPRCHSWKQYKVLRGYMEKYSLSVDSAR